MSPSEIKLVSWDIDGTLYSTLELRRELVKAHFRECGRRGPWSQGAREIREIGRFHRRFSKVEAVVTEEAFRGLERSRIRDLETRWFTPVLEKIGPNPEAVRWLKIFRQNRVRQATLSNFDGETKLKALGLDDFFEKNWSCERRAELKPSPAPFRELRQILGIDPQRHLHIGDRPEIDGRGAIESGAAFLDIRDLSTFDFP